MVPNHHTKQKICPNRPSYREGRKWKAVKVYTVNLEAKYLLVQGVPALGTCQELVKLFSTYGPIEEYRVLDDFPAEQFTEVYLIKYKNIHSARRAKKKFDDYSFFGGILHVSYAPEYETVEETREKLAERRKAVASRCRKLLTDQVHYDTKKQESSASDGDRVQSVLTDDNLNNTPNQNPTLTNYSNNSQGRHIPEDTNRSDRTLQSHCSSDSQTVNIKNASQPEVQYWLPPPPKNLPLFLRRPPPPLSPKWEYARVPSAHATLPANFETSVGRQGAASEMLNIDTKMKDSVRSEECDNQHRRFVSEDQCSKIKTSHTDARKSQISTSVVRGDRLHSTQDDSAVMVTEKNNETNRHLKADEKLVDGLLVKKIEKSGPPPRFIPRQINKPMQRTEQVTAVSSEKSKLRQNAFILGGIHGPENQKSSPEGLNSLKTEKSVKKSVLEIRKRVRQFTEEKMVKKTKKLDDT